MLLQATVTGTSIGIEDVIFHYTSGGGHSTYASGDAMLVVVFSCTHSTICF